MIDIVSVLDRVLLDESSNRRRVKNSHWPTSASIDCDGTVYGECLLKSYRQWKGVPETNPMTPDILQKMGWGVMIHNWTMETIEKHVLSGGDIRSVEKSVKFQMPVEGLTYPVSGEIDGILNRAVGLEIKSSFGKFFFGKNGLFATGPKPEYLMQTLLYMAARPDIEYFILLYIARDIGFKVPYVVMRFGDGVRCRTKDPKTHQDVVLDYPDLTLSGITARWRKLERCLADDTPPAPDFRYKSKYPCCYCSYKEACYPNSTRHKQPPQFDDGETAT